MNFLIRKQQQWKTKLVACILLALSYSTATQAAVIVVDIPDTTTHTFTTRLGNHPTFNYGHTARLNLNSGFLFTTGAEIGSNTNGEAFFQSGESTSSLNSHTSFQAYSAFGFSAGASSGINYARFTGNQASHDRYYIVVEFDFGIDADTSDDVITRYAYEDTDPNLFYINGAPNPNFPPTTLTVAEAEVAFAAATASAVPEPSSALLLGLGSFGILIRRRRR